MATWTSLNRERDRQGERERERERGGGGGREGGEGGREGERHWKKYNISMRILGRSVHRKP